MTEPERRKLVDFQTLYYCFVTVTVIAVLTGSLAFSASKGDRRAKAAAYQVAFDRCTEQLETVDAKHLAGCVEDARAIADEVRQQI